MSAHLFEPFSRMIDGMPTAAISAVVERAGQMLVDDLAHGRTPPDSETRSILSFWHFLKAIQSGYEIPPVVLPMEDTAFYRRTTERLVEAGKLPYTARERFDLIFSRPALKSLGSDG